MTNAEEAVVRAALRDFDRANDRLSRRGTLTAADRQAAAAYTKAAGDKLAALLENSEAALPRAAPSNVDSICESPTGHPK